MRSFKFRFLFKTVMAVIIFTLLFSGCSSGKLSGNESGTDRGTESSGEKGSQTDGTTGDPSSTLNTGTESSGSGSETSAPQNETTGNTPTKNVSKVKVKALYLTGWTVGSTAKVNHYVELAKNTEINSYVIDIKDDDGYVGYESSIPEVRELGAWQKKYNADKVLKAFHDANVHIIGRLVCFKDPVLSSKKPDLAVHNASGGLWKDNHKLSWLNPYDKDSWPYIISIAKEAVEKGFDEIQFDYVRFPNDGNKKDMNFGNVDNKPKYEAINEFLAYAKKELPGVPVSADVFGIICESPADTEGIGQYLELVGKDVDYLSPMVYPSHYAVGQIVNKVKFAKPDFDPYNVVYNSLVKAKNRAEKAEGFKADLRPYLQDFTATWLGKGYYQTYGAKQVREQIKAVYDAGYDQWILWDANNTYDEDALLKGE